MLIFEIKIHDSAYSSDTIGKVLNAVVRVALIIGVVIFAAKLLKRIGHSSILRALSSPAT